jgi:hypothetical protein
MNKLIVSSILAAVSVVGAAELIDVLAPKAAAVTLESSLKNLYTDAYTEALLTQQPVGTVLQSRLDVLQSADAGIRYELLSDGSLVASNDWACRRLVAGDLITVVECDLP